MLGVLLLALLPPIFSQSPVPPPYKGDIAHFEKPLGRLAFLSCTHQDRSTEAFAAVAAEHADFTLHLGDIVYADERMFLNQFAVRSTEGRQAVFDQMTGDRHFAAFREAAGDRFTAIFDDHDRGLNNAGVEFEDQHESKEMFLRFIGEPETSARHGRDGLYGSVTFGSGRRLTRLLLLDTRSFRDRPGRLGFNTHRDPLGEEQWAWLEAELRAGSAATTTIVASSIQVLSDMPIAEGWKSFTDARLRLLQLLHTHVRGGLVLLSGDVHMGEVLCCNAGPESCPFAAVEVTSSGLTHSLDDWPGVGPLVRYATPGHNRFGLTFRRNYGLLTIDEGTSSIHVDVRAADGPDAGTPLLSLSLPVTPGATHPPTHPSSFFIPFPWIARAFFLPVSPLRQNAHCAAIMPRRGTEGPYLGPVRINFAPLIFVPLTLSLFALLKCIFSCFFGRRRSIKAKTD
jgi:alkaline phosphatase D